MSSLFIGFLLILINIDIQLNSSTIGLLPDFIGFIFIAKGLNELKNVSSYFSKISSLTTAMIFFSLFNYFMNIFSIRLNLGVAAFILGIFEVILRMIIMYFTIRGISEMEQIYSCDLNAAVLKKAWLAILISYVFIYLLIWMPSLALLSIVLNVAFCIWFLVSFYKTKTKYFLHLK